jgi:thiamine biosynthesis protein ThiI
MVTMNSVVVHYQEIALKGKNRPWFLGRLVRNLREAVADLDVEAVRPLMGRIEIVLGPAATREAVAERVSRTFGIANFSFAGRTRLDLDVLTQAILRDLRGPDVSQLPGVGAPGRQAFSTHITPS